MAKKNQQPQYANLELIEVHKLLPDPLNHRNTLNEDADFELAASIKSNGIIQPLTVRPCTNDNRFTYYVVCGHRRLRAAKIASLNSRTERWKPIDFVKCYCANGNKQYKIIQQFIEAYNMPVSSALLLLHNGYSQNSYSQRQMREFESGTYIVKHEEEALEIADYSLRFENFPQAMAGSFLKALCQLFRAGLMDKEVLIKKYNDNPDALTSQGSHKAYLVKLEEIYNYRNSKRQPIY